MILIKQKKELGGDINGLDDPSNFIIDKWTIKSMKKKNRIKEEEEVIEI